MAEIERKFRLPTLPDPRILGDGDLVLQGYLLTDAVEVRVRKRADRCYLTVKGQGTIERDEWETDIPAWAFGQLWPETAGRRIEKTRYLVQHSGFSLEVDEYHGQLRGLVILECELDSREAANGFELPEWASTAQDVSADQRFKNRNLAVHGLPTWFHDPRDASR